jgi:N-formylglutamate deformylase
VTHVVDGRFKGGYITRHYGRPHEGIHVVQMEMCQALYMEERPPWRYDEAKAARIVPVLRRLVEALLTWRPEHA